MGDFGPDSGGRIKGLTIIKPIVYGNIARYFGKKREEDGHTHQWTVYVKSFRNEDLSNYVKKVHFKLHESYPNQNRVVTKPPYEVTETGWGEFEVVIKIYFNDSNERPVTLYHLLKLFQSETDIMLGKKSLVCEFYDELMFQDPTQMMHQLLTNVRPIMMGTYRHENDFEEKREKTVNNILNAKNKIRYEIAELNERLKQSKETILKYKNEILKMEECDDVLTQPLQCPTTSLPSSTAVSLPSATSSASTVSLNVSVDNGATTPTTVTTATTSEVPTSLSISSSATTSINTLSI
ncbi:YEATS domain-containing protein 4 [Octopus sinensis]|uniref:YEATS domain-containing protein 4 n=1 Tax=Octopus sinensis TaxID=2607531 RepID=A0A6P7S5X5_9MOLL|nr:YEATS domain-containing protein 4 [Octopus sinensis]